MVSRFSRLGGEKATVRRPAGAGGWLLLEFDEELTLGHHLTDLDVDRLDHAVARRGEVVLHLHRLEDEERVAAPDALASPDVERDDDAGDVGDDESRRRARRTACGGRTCACTASRRRCRRRRASRSRGCRSWHQNGGIPCFLAGRGLVLVRRDLHGVDQEVARLARRDHRVDVAVRPRRCRGWRTSRCTPRPSACASPSGSAASAISLRKMMLAAPSGPMTAISARRPGEDEVGAEVARAHGDVAAAVGLAQDDRDLRHGGLAVGVEELGAVADHPGVLLVDAREVARAGRRR